MKNIILSILIFLNLNVFSQDFTYKFNIKNVNSLSTAKEITDPLRIKFGTYPLFNDSTDTFEFNSNKNISKNDLTSLLDIYSYVLINFKKTIRSEIIKEEE